MDINTELSAVNKWQNLRRKCEEQSIPFGLSVTDVRRLLGVKTCYYTRIPLIRGEAASNFSLDRKIPSLGYVRGNVVACDVRVNRLKANLSPRDIKKLANKLSS